MTGQHLDSEKWEMIGFVKVSPTRYQILKTIESDFMMPSEIARFTGLRITQVSNALHDLKEKNLVYCLNEHVTKGRLYKNTPLGLEILLLIDENKKD